MSELTLSQKYPAEMLPVKVIPLTQGYFTIIDPEDYNLVSQFRWQIAHTKTPGLKYAQAYIGGGMYEPRIVHMNTLLTGLEASDHINRNGLDNRRSNLRECTQSQNNANQSVRSDNSSGFKGVSFRPSRGTWRAYIVRDGRQTYLGSYSTPERAARAYDKAAKEFYGEFARTNKSMGLL